MPAVLLSLALLSLQTGAPAVPRRLEALIQPILDESGLPALGAALVTSQGLEALGAVGLRSWEGEAEVTSEDRWHLGSCTKALTATLVARLVERGTLTWQTTLGDVFAGTVPGMDPAWKPVSILWLLCHRSGASLNFDADLWQRMTAKGGTPREQRRFFVAEGLLVAPESTPNTETLYSNAGYMLAGAMLEELAGASWEELVQREVLAPLGMTSTGFGAPGTPGKLDQPLGHARGADGWTPIALGPEADNPPVVGPAGTVHATLADWARFVSAHLRGARGDESFLKAASWQRLHAKGAADWSHAPGWLVSDEPWAGGALLSHLGSNTYWVCQANLAPAKDLAVLIVTNVGDDAAKEPFERLLAALLADHAAHAR